MEQEPPSQINWTPIGKSTTISDIAYDPKEQKMFLRFNTGAEYKYYDVLQEEYDAIFEDNNSSGRNAMALSRVKMFKKIS